MPTDMDRLAELNVATARALAKAVGEAPAGEVTELAKAASEPGDTMAVQVLKAADEQRYVLGVAYFANKPDVAKAMDGHRDMAAADVVEKAAWDWLRKSRESGLWHQQGTVGHVEIVESYIYRGPDWQIGDTVVKAGDWLVGAICDEAAWDLRKAKKLTGWSPQGTGKRAVLTAERAAEMRS